MIVDNTDVITGGRNISDNFLQDSDQSISVSHDLDVLLITDEKSGIIEELNRLFSELLNLEHTKIKKSRVNARALQQTDAIKNEYASYQDHINYLESIENTMIKPNAIKLLYSSLTP